MTLPDVLDVALAAYDEDEAEREAIIEALAPVLLGDRELLRAAIRNAWINGCGNNPGVRLAAASDIEDMRDEIRDAIRKYQRDRAAIDSEIAAADGADRG